MNYPLSRIHIKEKVRYDINAHREQNKRIILNIKRGLVAEEQDREDAFNIEDMKNLALQVSNYAITSGHLKVLKHALLNGEEFITTFCQVPGAVKALFYYVTHKNENLQLNSVECFCNLALGNKEMCNEIMKLVCPYFTFYVHHLNTNISSISIWTLGNLCYLDEDSCELLQKQNYLESLVICLRDSTCDDVISNTFYTLKLLLKTYINYLPDVDLHVLYHVCLDRMDTWKETFWIVYQISCRQVCTCRCRNEHLVKRLFSSIHTDDNSIGIKHLVPILRTFGNTVAMDSSGCSAKDFIVGLRNEGSVIKNILLQNRHINLNEECAWLLGNVLNVLKINDLNNNDCLTAQQFDEICNCLFV